MTNEAANLVLEHLRAIRSDAHEIKTVQRDHGHRLTRLKIGVAALRRDQAGDAENVAHLESRMDQMRDDIERIKRRLDKAVE
jgi:hypothetical protein